MLKTKKTSSQNYYMLPLAAVLLLLPLLVRCHIFNPKLNDYPWMEGAVNRSVDMYLYYRSVFLTAAGGVLCFLLLHGAVFGKEKGAGSGKLRASLRKLPPPLWLLLAYLLLCIPSALFSINPYFSLHGISYQFESLFVLLAYGLLTVYTFASVNQEHDVEVLLCCLVAGCAILCAFGLSQLLSYDLWLSPFLKPWVFPGDFSYNIEANMGEAQVSMAFSNPNYVGLYAALLAPVLVSFFLTRKGWRRKVGVSLLGMALLVCLLGSGAKNGLIAVGAGLLLLLLFRHSFTGRLAWKRILTLLVCAAAVIIALLTIGSSLLEGIVSGFQIEKRKYALEDIRAGQEDVTVVYEGESLHASIAVEEENVRYSFRDGQGQKVSAVYDETAQEFYFTDPRFTGIRAAAASFNGLLGMNLKIDGKDWPFTNQTEDGSWYYLNSVNKPVKPEKAKTVLFNGYESLFSGRGYIWGRTLPLLFQYFPFGSGPDTFLLVFPQNDYVMASNSGYTGQLVSRPHNMYLQIGVQTGVFSLLAFVGFFLLYLLSSLRLYWRSRLEESLSRLGGGYSQESLVI